MRVAAAAVLAVVAFAGSARAETAPPWDMGCYTADAVVPASLPANVTGIPILAPVDMVSASLLAADGTVVATKLVPDAGFSLVVPLAPLTAGASYTLRWSDECMGYRTKTFIATAAVPLPSTAGTAVVGPYQDYFAGKCDSSGRPMMTRQRAVYLSESPDLKPWLSISEVDFIIDGVDSSSGTVRYGHATGNVVGGASIKCPGEDKTHKVAVRVRLPNGLTLITPDVGLTLDCPDVPPKPCVDEPEGEVPAPGEDDAGVGVGVDAGNTPSATPSDDVVRAGCHYSPGELGGLAWVLGLGGAVVMRRRRAR